MALKYLIPTSKTVQSISILKINWLMLLTEIKAAYSENHTTRIHALQAER
jgi:hypothetical protein